MKRYPFHLFLYLSFFNLFSPLSHTNFELSNVCRFCGRIFFANLDFFWMKKKIVSDVHLSSVVIQFSFSRISTSHKCTTFMLHLCVHMRFRLTTVCSLFRAFKPSTSCDEYKAMHVKHSKGDFFLDYSSIKVVLLLWCILTVIFDDWWLADFADICILIRLQRYQPMCFLHWFSARNCLWRFNVAIEHLTLFPFVFIVGHFFSSFLLTVKELKNKYVFYSIQIHSHSFHIQIDREIDG